MAFLLRSRGVLQRLSLSSQFAVIRHSSSTLTSPRLFISGLSRLTTDEKLKEAFSPFGHLLDAKVVTDRVSGRSKGFGFITYATIEEAERAQQGMNAKFLDGWVIFVDPANAKPHPHPHPHPQPQHSSASASTSTSTSESGFTSNKTIGWCG